MDSVNRKEFQFLAENLGDIRHLLVDSIGDLSNNPGTQLEMESLLSRLYGSTVLHDEDYAKTYVYYDSKDRVEYGIQGAFINSPTSVAIQNNYTSGAWNPSFAAPCLEGWGINEYHIWKYWQPDIANNPNAWDITGETNGSIAIRQSKTYPVRYTSGTYHQVALFNSVRWISIQNTSGAQIVSDTGIRFTVDKSYFYGCKIITNIDNKIIADIAAYNFGLLQTRTDDEWDASSVPASLPINTPIYIEDKNNGKYEISFIYQGDNWADDAYFHLAFYWGSNDDFIDLSSSAPIVSTYAATSVIVWDKKNFFNNDIVDKIGYQLECVNDTQPYIFAPNKTHLNLYDGQYTQYVVPEKYELPSEWKNANDPADWFSQSEVANTLINSFVNLVNTSVSSQSVIPVLICAKTSDTVLPKIVVGPEITPEFFPAKWEDCSYFPAAPKDYIVIAKFVISNANNESIGTIEYGNVFDKTLVSNYNVIENQVAVVWYQQIVPTFATKRIEDESLYLFILPALQQMVQRFRDIDISTILLNVAFVLLAKASKAPVYLINNISDIIDESSLGSNVFRGLLKIPNDDDMRDDNGKLSPVYFTNIARKMISDFCGAPPSTDLLRFEANNMYLTNEQLNKAKELEIYQESSSQCFAVDIVTSGSKVGKDYTFRLELEDENENSFFKDWYIMASKYYVSEEEYSQLANSDEGTLGYFNKQKLEQIDEWRLNGYAGIVPDLSMSKSCLLRTRVVHPQDTSKITKEEFIQEKQNQGLTETQINEAVLVYLEDGNTFYEVDLNQYSNRFVGVKNASLSITDYSYTTEPYWTSNISSYFNNFMGNSIDFDTLKADSFTVAQSGLVVGSLETYGIKSNDILPLMSPQEHELIFIENARAFRIVNTTEDFEFVNFVKLQMKVDFEFGKTVLDNADDAMILISLYSDNNGPDVKLVDGEFIKYNDLTSDFTEIQRSLSYVLQNGQSYWLVLEKNATPVGGNIVIKTVTATGSSNGYYLNSLPSTRVDHTIANTETTSNADISFSSYDVLTNTLHLGTPLTELGGVSLSQSSRILVNNLTNAEYNGIYNYKDSLTLIRAVDANLGSFFDNDFYIKVVNDSVDKTYKWSKTNDFILNTTDISFLDISDSVWVIDPNFASRNIWRQLSSIQPIILGAFNREDQFVNTILAPANKNRELSDEAGYQVDGYWNFTIKKFPQPQKIQIYPRACYDEVNQEWAYIPSNRDIHVLVRAIQQEQILDLYALVPAGEKTGPINLGNEFVDGIVFMAIAKGKDQKSARVATTNSTIGEADSGADIEYVSFSSNKIITHNAVSEIDGIQLQNGDRILIKNLIDAQYNGIYEFDTNIPTELTRTNDLNDSSQIYDGFAIRVVDGNVNKNKYYQLTGAEDPIVLNYTDITFIETQPLTPEEFDSPYYGGNLSDILVIRSS